MRRQQQAERAGREEEDMKGIKRTIRSSLSLLDIKNIISCNIGEKQQNKI